MLDVIKGTSRFKKSKYPLAVNLAVLGMIFIRVRNILLSTLQDFYKSTFKSYFVTYWNIMNQRHEFTINYT